jgi:L-asparaginase II
MNPIVIEVLRGGYVESTHTGAVAVADANGVMRIAIGDVDRPVFPRSAVKALQALPLVASGAADALRLTDAELALACASHAGEPEHVATAAGMLAKAGVDERALECGVHWPSGEAAARALARDSRTPGALHNNCSGKHSGFVCVGCLMARAAGQDVRAFVKGYVRPDHPVMRQASAALQAATGADLERAPRATDGCSIPTFGIPLRRLAHGFARFATGIGLASEHADAAKRLRSAVAAAPFMVAGTGRFGTVVMQHFGARVFVKSGAEGVYCGALPALGLGIALKIDDGNTTRAEVAMATVLEALLPADDGDHAFLRGLNAPVLKNWNGIAIGGIGAAATFRAALGGTH